MEKFILEHDIKLICHTADSFPEGILNAHQTLHGKLKNNVERGYFGISQMTQTGDIIYKAAVEEVTEGEAQEINCENVTLKKGIYIGILIKDYMKDLSQIGTAFQQLIANPDIDMNGWAVEMYLNQHDVRCMVRLDERAIHKYAN